MKLWYISLEAGTKARIPTNIATVGHKTEGWRQHNNNSQPINKS